MKEQVEEIRQMITDLAVKTVDTGQLATEIKGELDKVAASAGDVRGDISNLSSQIDTLANLSSSAAREAEIEIRDALGSIKWRV